MTFEIHPTNPTTKDRRFMEHAIKMMHEAIGREIQSLQPGQHPAGQILMVMRDGTVSRIPDLSRTQEESITFLAHMRRVVAAIKPAFVLYANLCEPAESEPDEEAIQFVAESARRAIAIGTAPVRRRGVHPPVVEPVTTEFLQSGDVVDTEVGAFFAALTDESVPKPALN